jgi:tagatose 6-phosphate kinase
VIVAAGLSPAWQQILAFDALRWGEVNRAATACCCASGKVLNVGIALAHLGAESLTIAPLGGPARQPIAVEFAALGGRGHWIEVETPTRVCTTLIESAGGRTTELVENAASLSAAELAGFETAYLSAVDAAQAVVLTGSIPRGTPVDLFRRLLEATRAPAILDLRGPELAAALDCRPLLVKPNREELAHTLGRPVDSDAVLREAMLELNQRGAQWVVVSQGASAVWVASAGSCYRLQPPRVSVVNAIGSGDCLAAGIALQIARQSEPLGAIRFGVAAASLNATMLLPGRIELGAVESLAESITIEAA